MHPGRDHARGNPGQVTMHILLILFLAPAVIYAGVRLARPIMIVGGVLFGVAVVGVVGVLIYIGIVDHRSAVADVPPLPPSPQTDAELIDQWCAKHPDNENCRTDGVPPPQTNADITKDLKRAQAKGIVALWCAKHPDTATCQ